MRIQDFADGWKVGRVVICSEGDSNMPFSIRFSSMPDLHSVNADPSSIDSLGSNSRTAAPARGAQSLPSLEEDGSYMIPVQVMLEEAAGLAERSVGSPSPAGTDGQPGRTARPTPRFSLNLSLLSLEDEPQRDIEEVRRNSDVALLRDASWMHFAETASDKIERFERALAQIEATEIGKLLLECLDAASKQNDRHLTVFFRDARLGVEPHSPEGASNGRGTYSNLYCNLDDGGVEGGLTPGISDVLKLFHELVHVYHNVIGERVLVQAADPDQAQFPHLLHEEARTVGLGMFRDEQLCENRLRSEIGVQPRASATSGDWVSYDDDTAIGPGASFGLEQRSMLSGGRTEL